MLIQTLISSKGDFLLKTTLYFHRNFKIGPAPDYRLTYDDSQSFDGLSKLYVFKLLC